MKKQLLNRFMAAYVVALAFLAFVGYTAGNYTIQTEHHKAVEKQYFATDMALYDLPRMTINIPAVGKSQTRHVRIDVSLEVAKQDMPRLSSYEPRIIDKVSTYMRHQDADDLRPSSAMHWLHETILNEVNNASNPVPVHDVIFRQFVIL